LEIVTTGDPVSPDPNTPNRGGEAITLPTSPDDPTPDMETVGFAPTVPTFPVAEVPVAASVPPQPFAPQVLSPQPRLTDHLGWL
jgi:hypothetical protein